MRKVLLSISLLVLVGCNQKESKSSFQGSGTHHNILCIEGVNYIVMRSYSSIAPLLNTDGSISTCIDEESLIEYEEDLAFYE